MTLRLRQTASGAPYTPTTVRAGWENATQVAANLATPTPSGFASNRSQAVGSLTANWDVILRRFTSPAFTVAGTLGGTLSYVMPLQAETAALNGFVRLHVYVTAGSTDTVRGILLNEHIGPSMPITMTGLAAGPLALTSVACQVGDRICMAVGYRASSNSTARIGYFRHGGTATPDLAAGQTGNLSNPGWIEFSDLVGDDSGLQVQGAPPAGPPTGRYLISAAA